MSFHPDERKKKQSSSVSLEEKKKKKNHIPLDIAEIGNVMYLSMLEREDFISWWILKKKKEEKKML